MFSIIQSCAYHRGHWRIRAIAATLSMFAIIGLAVTGCGGGSSGSTTPTVAVPGEPTSFTVIRTPEAILSATLDWSIPASGGEPTSYEIYRSTTAGSVFQSDNHVISIPVEAGKTTYTYVDNAGLTPVDTYWVVSAKNAGGETPTAEVMYKPIGPPNSTGDTGYGNNFSAALIFADDIGISGQAITGTWTNTLANIDTATGLRPTSEDIAEMQALPVPVTTLPYFDPATAYTLDNITYYKQQTISSWQGQWETGAGTLQHVNAAWGDNLVSQNLTTTSTIRIEMVLSKALTAPMTSYWMESLYGTRQNEIQGTDGTTYDNPTAFVFASNARLTIQKLDASGNPDGAPLYNQTLWQGDGPGFLAGEVNVSGNFTYGFVWNLKNQTLPADITTGKAGTWQITFSLDSDNSAAGGPALGITPPLASNHTSIDTVSNGVLVSSSEVYINIHVSQ